MGQPTSPAPSRMAQYATLTAALLGWMFDGFEMGLFPVIGKPALKDLLTDQTQLDRWLAVIMGVFLVGAASGGVLFGWLGDKIGRVRAMSLSILTYALLTGLCGFATQAWQIAALRFIASLGMGGEWSLGVALVNEIWPGKSRAFIAGLIGAASNVGFLLVALLSMGLSNVLSVWKLFCLRLLAVDLLNQPSSPPYMIAPRGLLPYWEGACASDRRLKVGIVWAGNPRYLGDSLRSTRLRDWLPLFDLTDVSFYSLQKDVASNQPLAWDDLDLQNIAIDCESWEKTANAIAMLDLVISVDTGVAHLAACLGKPTWIVLPGRGTDFRWMLEREDVPWYPQDRLFRQKVAEPWSEVFLRVRKQLSDDLPSLRHGI